MTEEEKKLQTQAGAAAPAVYGGQYDRQINDAYQQITGRQPFQYSLDGDALYQQYKDRYTQNAKRSMQDTMGQAASLTGGYGSSYAQGVGQQAYDETMRGLTDLIPTLESRAYNRYQAEGDRLLQQYNLLNQMGAADQATRQYDQEWDFTQRKYNEEQDFQKQQYADEQTQRAYSNLSTAILTAGYRPSAEEMAAAGMSAEEANALRQAWIGSNPAQAWLNGAISGEDYYRLTGEYPFGYDTGSGGGGSGGWGGYSYANAEGLSNSEIKKIQTELNNSGYNAGQVDGIWGPKTESAYNAAAAASGGSGASKVASTVGTLAGLAAKAITKWAKK